MTTVDKRIPLLVPVDPPEEGVRQRSFIKCEDVWSINHAQRLAARWGIVSSTTLCLIEDRKIRVEALVAFDQRDN